MMACMGTLTFFALVLVVLTASSPTGIVAIGDADLPLTPGFATAFKMTERFATILSLPMLFATGYGFMFAAGQQVSAMASSGLYIKLLSQSFGYRKVPCFALIFAAFSATVIMVICLLAIRTNLVLVYNVCALGSFIVYISMFVSYLVFSKRYEALQRNFINPFGKGSAIYGCVVFVIGIISVLGFQNDFGAAFIAFFVYVFVMIVYYYLVSKGRQCYSKEEQSILLAAYIINSK